MSHKVNLVRVLTAATGNSTPITLGAAYSQLFMTPAEAGAMNGRVYTYLIVDGNDWELGKGVYTSSGTTLARTTVLASRISGTLGTSRISLSGTAQVRFVESAEDMDGVRGTRAVTGTSDVIANSDQGYAITYSNAAAIAVTLAQASASNLFLDGWATTVQNLGAGTVTITPATSTINGASTLVLAQNMGAFIWSDGTNYHAYFVPVTKPLLAGSNLSDGTAATMLANLGGTTVGKALFTATDAAAARTASGAAPNDLSNISLAVSAAAGALTIALKDGAGNDATATTPIVLDFRDPTGTTGTKTKLAVAAAASLVLSSGSTLGVTSSTAFRIWVVGFNDAGTFRLGAVLCTDPVGGRFALLEARPASSTAEGGAGAADSSLTIYTGTAVTGKSFRVLGYIEWNASGVTAGTWTTTNISYVQTFGPGVKLPGEVLQRRWAYTSTPTSNATSTFTDTNLQKAITPISAANAVRAKVQGGVLCPAASSRAAVQIRRGSGASGPQIGVVAEAYGNATTAIMPVTLDWLDFPYSASAVTYTAQVASQSNTGSVQFPQTPSSSSNVNGFIELEEIQS